ncbi:hypothetical protein GA0116948_104255 [Chitinophaga costaii]|uniref:Capsule assembly protein Wzi n=1 Tax=Chitinophaga costaii TaxID=1335309 RepID=A0A1C4CR83_9BACT|nr:hypothetical protein [Chitinophaga costaii]PUZ26985.1 hypothetical protein DCM91_07030 [Chitinophaga costaii]SCC21614.1 hypothetical protein GA0116948_104255 [Chitinophaga costaii]
MTRKPALLFSILYFYALTVSAQHETHAMHTMQTDSTPMANDSMPGMDMNMDMPMGHSFSLNLPMNRNGSGTGWLPDASPMYGYMFMSKKWMYMLHGNIFLRYEHQDIGSKGSRGGEKWDAPNWLMFMGQRKIGQKGLFHFSTMLSLDAAIGGNHGYPLLFQTGESYRGQPLVDYQHPHDLFSELSVAYTYAFNERSDLTFYFGYPGEPALGSVAFMHRASAQYMPDAPLTHHWNDGTHITFGVATVGYRYDKWKLEVSSFTGREPNEHRYDFDKMRFDSYSGRLSFAPSENWSFQVSHGYIKGPEDLHPDENVHRTTVSGIYSLPLKNYHALDVTALYGLNKVKGNDGESGVLLEAALRLKKWALYTRYEFVQKDAEELNLDNAGFGHDAIFPVNALTLGLNRDLFHIGQTRFAAGAQATGYAADHRLDNLYGKNPWSGEVFLRIYPGKM